VTLNTFGGKTQVHCCNVAVHIFFNIKYFAGAKVTEAHTLRICFVEAKKIFKLVGIYFTGAVKHLSFNDIQVCFASYNAFNVPIARNIFELALVWDAAGDFNQAFCSMRSIENFIIV